MATSRTNEQIEEAITEAVFYFMKDTPVPAIKVGQVIERADVSRSTFYRHFKSVDEVVKLFEARLLDNMRSINRGALKSRFGVNEIVANTAMVTRMEFLHENRDKILALNGPNGDPSFQHKATVFMHNYMRDRIRDIPGNKMEQDFWLSFAVAGHNNLVQFWLEVHPEISPEYVANILCKLFYSPFFLSGIESMDVPEKLKPHAPTSL